VYKWLSLMLGTTLAVVALWAAPTAQSAMGTGGAIAGNIKGADGRPIEGVIVSARASDESFTTSVFTDRQGNYIFPSLAAGQYKIWAQAVGFEAGGAEFALGSSRVDRNFTLTELKVAAKILKQMSGAEYLNSLPQSTPADRRMVHVFKNNCTSCHTSSYVLQNRWDEHGWGIMVDLMSKMGSSGAPPNPKNPGNRMTKAYEQELAEYLGRARGATELTLGVLKPLPRPTGEATQVVITEYDLPRTDGQIQPYHGSDWSMGTPSRFVGRAAHDVWPDAEGNVWIADDAVPDRTIAKLDSRTGKVTDYSFKNHEGKTVSTHTAAVDVNGKVWASNRTDRTFILFDPRTEQFTNFMRPEHMPTVGSVLHTDSKGNPWATSENGAIKLDAATGQYTYYEAPPAEGGSICGNECGNWNTYGIAVDRDDNAWITQPGLDRLVKVDGRTGQTTSVLLEALLLQEVTAVDRERRRTIRASGNQAPPGQKAPRRNMAAPNDDVVWAALYTSDRLARIDTKTLRVREYPMTPYTMPYSTAVDRNGVVYISTINQDAIVKFNPTTERFTEYYLPTRGTEIRLVQVDNTTDPPTVWASYNRSNKVARLQFRAP